MVQINTRTQWSVREDPVPGDITEVHLLSPMLTQNQWSSSHLPARSTSLLRYSLELKCAARLTTIHGDFSYTSLCVLPSEETAVISESKSIPILSATVFDHVKEGKEKKRQNTGAKVGANAHRGKFTRTNPGRQFSTRLQSSS